MISRFYRWRGIAVVAVLALSLQAQEVGFWTLVNPTSSPMPASGRSAIYDAARDRMVLFQGSRVHDFDGTDWVAGYSDGTGQDRVWWDPQLSQVVQFDVDYSGTTPIGASLKSWTGSSWTLLGSAPVPHMRLDQGSFAFDAARRIGVWYLGTSSSSDTWIWSGATWAQRSAGGPIPRMGATMAFDPLRQEVVLFGGVQPQGGLPLGPLLRDTWSWNGVAWTEHFGISAPTARCFSVMAHDSHRGRLMLFGGANAGLFPVFAPRATENDVWEWDGASWTQSVISPFSPTPPDLAAASLGFDSLRNRFVLFGGADSQGVATNQTWIYERLVVPLAAFTSYGQGCPGPAGSPVLSNVVGSVPRLGQSCDVVLSGLPNTAFSIPVLVAGFDNQSWNGQALPMSLAPLGMPGCLALVRPDLGMYLVNSNGTANWSLAVPSAPSLAGVHIFLQGGVSVPGWNAAGFVASNAAHLIVGY